MRRSAGESILVGDAVEVWVLEVAGKQVKIGVIAPREIAIRRTELEELNRQALLPSWRGHGGLEALAGKLRHDRDR